ncbi:MAG: glycosyltransferase family 9 protein [Bacteroidetes bacterium]|nr:glycosyltransferase family 9 protein [Bacteroidota bacterium]
MSQILSRIGRRLKPLEVLNRRFWMAALRRVWRNRPLERKLKARDLRRVLFLRYDAIGDMITTLPALELLKRLNPSVAIDVMASPRNRRVIEMDPNVDRIIELRSGLRGLLHAIREARRERYDAIICAIFGRSSKVGIVANLIGGRRAVKGTIWKSEAYGAYFNVQSRSAAILQSMWDRVPHVLCDVIDIDPEAVSIHPYLAIGETSRNNAVHRLRGTAAGDGPYLLMNLSVSHARNVWPADNYERLATLLRERYPLIPLLLLAMPDDRSLAERLVASCGAGGMVNAYPPTDDVLEVAAVVERCVMLFSSDTGIVHMASATHRPVAAMYAGNVAATDWGPYGVPCRMLVSADADSVASIAVDDAFAACCDLVELGIAGPASERLGGSVLPDPSSLPA